MNKASCCLNAISRAAAILAIVLGVHCASAEAQSSFSLLSPTEGSVVTAGQNVSVQWTGGDPSELIDVYLIELTPDFPFAAVGVVASSTTNTGTVSWVFPEHINYGSFSYDTCGHSYLFYVQNVEQTTWTYGPHFTAACVTPPTTIPPLALTAPAAGSVVTAGDVTSVQWTGGDPTSQVNIGLIESTPGFPNAVVATVAANVPNSGSFDGWIFPEHIDYGSNRYETCGHGYRLYLENGERTAWTYGPLFSVDCVIEAAIDVKPDSVTNAVNPRSLGVIVVLLPGSADLPAASIDLGTVRFGATGSEASPAHIAFSDANHDGRPDTLFQFPTAATGIACGSMSVQLTARTVDGRRIHGADSIRTEGCK
jgi:hypothetical protein